MLSPKRTKFRKQQRGRMKGLAHRGNTISFGDFALQATEPSWITSRQIEAARRAMTRYIRRGGKIWIRIFPDKPVTMRPVETRMGSGKGSPEYWVAVVKPGRIMFEIAGVSEEVAREAMRLASNKLPIKTKFIVRIELSEDYLESNQADGGESESQVQRGGDAGSKIDAFLQSAFDLLDKGYQPEGIGMIRNKRSIPLFPMMVEVNNPSWKANNLPDYRETERLGRFIGCWGSKDTIRSLEKDLSVISVGASFQGGGGSNSSSLVESSCLSSCNFLELIKADDAHKIEQGNKAIIAIVDTGIDVLHDAFLGNDGKTRILGIFDLTNDKKYTKDQIDEFVRQQSVPDDLGRDRGARGMLSDGTKKGGHGTHVASIAAGRAGTNFTGGVAPDAWIVVVKIPEIPIQGYLITFIKALKYIKKTATDFNLPVVINVSLGLHRGAHDGSDDVERMFESEEVLNRGEKPGYAIVKAAGNEKTTNRHAMIEIPPNQSNSLKWGGLQNRSQDIIELWFSPAADMEFHLQAPNSKGISNLVKKKNGERNDKGEFLNGNSYSIKYTVITGNNRLSQLLVNINKGSSDIIELGTWTLHVTNVDSRDQVIHAWIQSSEYQDKTCCFQKGIDQKVTLTIPGTGKNVITVAALKKGLNPYIKPAHWDDSSLGPTQDKREKPDVAALGDKIMAACSDSDNDICLMSGTSMAAPQVTGAIALFLSAREKMRGYQPGLSQITAAQINTAVTLSTQSRGSYSWNEATGYGLIDVKALLECLDSID